MRKISTMRAAEYFIFVWHEQSDALNDLWNLLVLDCSYSPCDQQA